jgi:hypothetical protein
VNEEERDHMTDRARLVARLQEEITPEEMRTLLAGVETVERLQADVRQRWEEALDRRPSQPWEAYRDLRRLLSANWVARAYALVGRALAEFPDPAPVTRAQAVVLLIQLEDCVALLQGALRLSPRSSPLPPMTLGPRVQDAAVPGSHLQALLHALEAVHREAVDELNQYSERVLPGAPIDVRIVERRLRVEESAAAHQVDTARRAIAGDAGLAEDHLWSALEGQLWFGQVLFDPALLSEPQTGRDPDPLVDAPLHVSESEMHCLTPAVVEERLKEFGLEAQLEAELRAFWQDKSWALSEDEQRFLVEIAELEREGTVAVASYLDETPYNEVWVARESITIGDRYILAGSEFAYDHRAGQDRVVTDLESPPPAEDDQEPPPSTEDAPLA